MGYYGFLKKESILRIIDKTNEIALLSESKQEHLGFRIVVRILPDKL